ncbi:uncharacterized protein LOC129194852 [Dunckerocampus dactyliophorus]|uniref:uncharacterized protein LOC129194852 n=1 Tax=Dunckerocampus dactyliophorus TaxID=161453 RepID=UPI0024070597|nr:uncharacterized protein LOC129194852 [Dunckerocampus dactyliophorus]
MMSRVLTCLLLLTFAHTDGQRSSSDVRHLPVQAGQNVTLECFHKEYIFGISYWYKQAPGKKPKLLASSYINGQESKLYGEVKQHPRFNLTSLPDRNCLNILDVQASDSATYYCIIHSLSVSEFHEVILMEVRSSTWAIPASVNQSASKSIRLRGSVTLSCTVHTESSCDEEHQVYWLRGDLGSSPGIVYTSRGSRMNGSCVYELPMSGLNDSDVGTYYCAVATCGHILFGNGTTLAFECDTVLVHILSGALASSILLIVILACSMNKTQTLGQADPQQASPPALAPKEQGDEDTDLHYTDLSDQKVRRLTRQRDVSAECVYSSIKQ